MAKTMTDRISFEAFAERCEALDRAGVRPSLHAASLGEMGTVLLDAARHASLLARIEQWAQSETLHLSVRDVRGDALHDAKADVLRLLRGGGVDAG